MPYANGRKIQFSLPAEEAAKLARYRSRNSIRSDSLAAKELLTTVLQRPSLLTSGKLDSVAIRERAESLEQRFISLEQQFMVLEQQSRESAQSIKQFADTFEHFASDWRLDAEMRDQDYAQQKNLLRTLKEALQALSGNVGRTTTANDD